ncbi:MULTISPECIES: UPF0262 family protein [Sinorhizobium]|uniref:UPF0262 family protein n=1 Tax=Sinorhizobium TaxID=28105 RepID=UPI000BE84051|nr:MULTISPECIES: UPF0262 family protein [Sinorhizobium]PDT50913.1 hypothetical protein CO664_24505 [Sinorhizobium sp. NG07B]POH25031.1 hypothetical protein ATY30_28745 [Sinorhizobium americanum]
MTTSCSRLSHVLVRCGFETRNDGIEREQALAIADLLENNSFSLVGHQGGPYRLCLEMSNGRLALHVATHEDCHIVSHYLSATPYTRLLRDYIDICSSYHKASRCFGPAGLQTIDMARRGIHNEAAELLKERLSGRVTIDTETARRLFTLIYAMLMREAAHPLLVGLSEPAK